jgi:hypothetical protein
VSAPGTVLADGTPLPALVGNGTVITGFPAATLKNAIETAGDLSLIQAVVQLTGTEFGVKPPNWPMPLSINITNIGYNCSKPKIYGSMCQNPFHSQLPILSQQTKTIPSFCFSAINNSGLANFSTCQIFSIIREGMMHDFLLWSLCLLC